MKYIKYILLVTTNIINSVKEEENIEIQERTETLEKNIKERILTLLGDKSQILEKSIRKEIGNTILDEFPNHKELVKKNIKNILRNERDKNKYNTNPEFKNKIKEYHKNRYNNDPKFKIYLIESDKVNKKKRKNLVEKNMIDFIKECKVTEEDEIFHFFLNDYNNQKEKLIILKRILQQANRNINTNIFLNKKNENKLEELKNEKQLIEKLTSKIKNLEELKNNSKKKEIEYLEKKFISYYNLILKKKDKIKIEEVDESIEKVEKFIDPSVKIEEESDLYIFYNINK